MSKPPPTRVTIAFSTLASRVEDLRLPDPEPDIEVLVLIQGDGATDAAQTVRALRLDVRVEALTSVGVARSRNEAIELASSDLVLFADDGTDVFTDGVLRMADAMKADPALAALFGRAVDEDGDLRKRYGKPGRLTRWNAAKVSTIELMIRRSSVMRSGVRFDPDFGAGTEQRIGDEYIFIADLLRAGLRCESRPIVVASHPADSSGTQFGTEQDARARAAVFKRVFDKTSLIARLAFLARRPTRFRTWAATKAFLR